ncbi:MULTISPECIES: hypothetical protein [Rhodococcus]|jgi:hypothetical protein|uniref:hypothetical protein n=1 Tax=Rhodococcus TaxID=1827 RepID=UPI0004A9994A|nr:MULTISPECIES: hypothetical protein [Rhodococcus]KDQ00361.1 hypothetical protein EN35_33955 [Rhodococcus qingshengii]
MNITERAEGIRLTVTRVDCGDTCGQPVEDTLEPTIDNGAAFARWVDAISDIIETAITEGELTDTPTTHRLSWNLCAGTIGAANASATLREDIDLATRIEDAIAAQLRNALTPA